MANSLRLYRPLPMGHRHRSTRASASGGLISVVMIAAWAVINFGDPIVAADDPIAVQKPIAAQKIDPADWGTDQSFADQSIDPALVQDPSLRTKIIAFAPADQGRFVGSPSVVRLDDGTLVASHDNFGPSTNKDTARIYRSTNGGKSWRQSAQLKQWWSGLFTHRGALYFMGTGPGPVVIRRSGDGGMTWTEPVDHRSGILTDRHTYHTSSMPVVLAHGRIWRAIERSDRNGLGGLQARMFSAPLDADLLDARSWTVSDELEQRRDWLPGREFRGWLEGNAVVSPNGDVVNMLRVHTFLSRERAALVHYDSDGKQSRFDPKADFAFMPGGAKKFNVRFDESSGRYWTLSNWVPHEDAKPHPARYRNRLALCSSTDLKKWLVHRLLLAHGNHQTHGFQYADWTADGDDLVAVVRAGINHAGQSADNYHNANTLLFLRLPDFRESASTVIDRY